MLFYNGMSQKELKQIPEKPIHIIIAFSKFGLFLSSLIILLASFGSLSSTIVGVFQFILAIIAVRMITNWQFDEDMKAEKLGFEWV